MCCYFVKLSVSLWRILLLFYLSSEGKSIAGAILPYDAFLVITLMRYSLDAEQEVLKKRIQIIVFKNDQALTKTKDRPVVLHRLTHRY